MRFITGALIVLGGCSADGRDVEEVVVTDSAGIEVVRNAPGLLDSAAEWAVEPDPVVSIGVVEGAQPYQFSRIAGIGSLSDGSIVVLDGTSREVRFFDENGEHRSTSGGGGTGPGELTGPQRLWVLPGDTIVIWDEGDQDFPLFDPAGKYIRSLELNAPAIQPIGFVAGHVLAGSSATATAQPGDPERITTNQQIFQLVDLDGPPAPDTLATLGNLQLFQWTNQGQIGFAPVPFTADGSAGAGGGHLVMTDGAAPRLLVYDRDGVLSRIVETGMRPERLDRSRFDAEVERRVAAASAENRQETRRHHSEMPVPEVVPPFAGIHVDRAGGVWTERFSDSHFSWPLQHDATDWTVFDPQGRLLATLKLPPGFTLHEVNSRGVLGVQRDDLGVEYVHLLGWEYPLAGPAWLGAVDDAARR